ncbi:MAG: glycosyltransferase [Elusimicrobiota bacterium]
MPKIKALYLSTSLNTGGTERFLAVLIENLGHKYDFTVGYLKEKGAVGKYLEEDRGIPVVKFSSPWKIRDFLQNNGVSLLHTFLYRANILGRFAGMLAKTPVVVSTQQAVDAWKKPYHAWIDGFTSRWCDCVIANSDSARSILISRDGVRADKISVVYNGLNFEKFKTWRPKEEILKELGISGQGPVIISTIRLHREKGADLLPEIARNTKKGIFLLAGDGPERKNIEVAVSRAGLGKRLLLLGWRGDINELLSVSDIFLMPSREESFPQSILEAMAMSLPVVASDVGGVKELVDEGVTGTLKKSCDTLSFSKALDYLIENPGKAGDMGRRGREKSLLFTEEKMIRSVDDIYSALLGRKNVL